MNMMKRLIPMALALALLAGCAQGAAGGSSSAGSDSSGAAVSGAASSSAPDVGEELNLDDIFIDRVEMGEEVVIDDEAVALAGAPAAINDLILPVASGTKVKENSRAKIDYSNVSDGYVMVNFTGTTKTRLKVLVAGPSYASTQLRYQYDLNPGVWATFPLSDGNGDYTISVMENTTGSKYAQVVSVKFNVTLTDEFAPFIRPNQYVDYANAPKTVAKAAELAGKETDPLKLVEVVYDYVVKNFTYDKQLAATVQSGYLPVLDNVLAAKKGICFDYAGLMTGMLRSVGVPCKLVTGYVPTGSGQTGYHAWISVYSEENGWVEGAIFFDGKAWQRMDPTFASSANSSDAILKYIGDGSNYSVKYVY